MEIIKDKKALSEDCDFVLLINNDTVFEEKLLEIGRCISSIWIKYHYSKCIMNLTMLSGMQEVF